MCRIHYGGVHRSGGKRRPMMTKLLAWVTIGGLAVAIVAHTFGARDLAEFIGTCAYFALALAVVAAGVEAGVRRG